MYGMGRHENGVAEADRKQALGHWQDWESNKLLGRAI